MKFLKTLSIFAFTAMMAVSCADNKAPKEDAGAGVNCADAVIENIMTRTSIRQFTDQPVAKDTLDLLVKAGMAAPSAMDARPWAYIIVTEREILDSLNAIKPYFNLKTATAAIVVCGDLSKTKEGATDYWVQDCSAATENILLAAHAYGLGAVWCGVYPNHEIVSGVSRILDIPENVIPLNVVTLGYPDENPEPKDKYNTANIHYQKW